MSSDNCCVDAEKARTALSSVSGALCDSGVVVPAEEWKYGEAVRGIVAERNALGASLNALCDAIAPPDLAKSPLDYGAEIKCIRAKLAMYEAATCVKFGRDPEGFAKTVASQTGALESWEAWAQGDDSEPTWRGLTRDEAIAKAFDLSKGGE